MNPLVVALVQVLVAYGPGAYRQIVELMHTGEPTKEDWLKVLDHATQKQYDDYIAEARVRLQGGVQHAAP